jgi:hypothetical protein
MVFGIFSVRFRITFNLVFAFGKNVSFIGPETSLEASRCVCSALNLKLKGLFLLFGGINGFIFFFSDVFNISLIIESQISNHLFVIVLTFFKILNELSFGKVKKVSFRRRLIGLNAKSAGIISNVHSY